MSWQDTGRDGAHDGGDRHEQLPDDFLLSEAAFAPLDSEAEFMGLLANVETGGCDGGHGFHQTQTGMVGAAASQSVMAAQRDLPAIAAAAQPMSLLPSTQYLASPQASHSDVLAQQQLQRQHQRWQMGTQQQAGSGLEKPTTHAALGPLYGNPSADSWWERL